MAPKGGTKGWHQKVAPTVAGSATAPPWVAPWQRVAPNSGKAGRRELTLFGAYLPIIVNAQATMKKGERAIFEIQSHKAYGERGSPPKIPGGATLSFDIELDSFLASSSPA
jgi:hypothetical protein